MPGSFRHQSTGREHSKICLSCSSQQLPLTYHCSTSLLIFSAPVRHRIQITLRCCSIGSIKQKTPSAAVRSFVVLVRLPSDLNVTCATLAGSSIQMLPIAMPSRRLHIRHAWHLTRLRARGLHPAQRRSRFAPASIRGKGSSPLLSLCFEGAFSARCYDAPTKYCCRWVVSPAEF